jgi:arginyl-tRNA synthetase
VLARARGQEVPEGGYRGEYVADLAAAVLEREPGLLELPEDEAVAVARDSAYEVQLAEVKQVLADFDVHFDVWFSERTLHDSGAVGSAVERLREQGHVYDSGGAVWLRTTDFGDDKDRVLIKSDGDPTYFLPDIAYHRDKFTRGAHLIDVLGADHHGYVRRMLAAVEALGHDRNDLEYIIGQNVTLLRGGEEVKLSKRRGDIILLREDVLDEVGPDAARFTYLQQSIDTRLLFDLDVVVQRTMDNPVFYVQMAHARLAGIARTAAGKGIERLPLDQVDLGLLHHQREQDLLTLLNELPEVVQEAAGKRAPHRLVGWAREFATAVHGFHHDCWVVSDEVAPALSQARLWLVEAARIGLVVALDLIGISAPERM